MVSRQLASLSLVVLMGVATVLLEVFAPQVITIFNDDPELLAIAVPGMRIIVSTLILMGPALCSLPLFRDYPKDGPPFFLH